jgi:hypothetical protein
MIRVHVRLNLEDEAREAVVRGMHGAALHGARLRRRREIKEGVEQQLHAYAIDCAAE